MKFSCQSWPSQNGCDVSVVSEIIHQKTINNILNIKHGIELVTFLFTHRETSHRNIVWNLNILFKWVTKVDNSAQVNIYIKFCIRKFVWKFKSVPTGKFHKLSNCRLEQINLLILHHSFILELDAPI